MLKRLMAAAVTAALAAGTAQAQGGDLCSDRPGLTSDPCLLDPGQLSIETSLADWTLDRRDGDREDTVLFADSLVRFGVVPGFELDLGWTPLGTDRDRADGVVERRTRVGDVTLGARAKLVDNEGERGFVATAVANVSLPSGRDPIAAGDWGAELTVATQYEFTDHLEVQVLPEIDAAVDDDGDGRHLRYGVAAELEFDIAEPVRIDVGGQVLRDRDPDRDERGTLALANIAVAVQPDDRTQLDISTNFGLNARSPDVQLVAGFTRRF